MTTANIGELGQRNTDLEREIDYERTLNRNADKQHREHLDSLLALTPLGQRAVMSRKQEELARTHAPLGPVRSDRARLLKHLDALAVSALGRSVLREAFLTDDPEKIRRICRLQGELR